MTGEFRSKNRRLLEEIKNLREDMSSMRTEFLSAINMRNKVVDKSEGEFDAINAEARKLESLVDDADAYERRDTVIISGTAVPAVTQGEICASTVTNLVKEKERLEMSSNEINTAHRIGKKNIVQTSDRKSNIVKFCRRDCTRSVISASRKTKDSKIVVNECLKPDRKSIFNALLAMKRAYPDLVKGYATFDGNIFAFTKPTPLSPAPARDQRHLIS